MNAERLNAIAITLRRELDERSVVNHLETLVNACQQLAQNPGNITWQQNYANAHDTFLRQLTDTATDSFTPAWRQVLAEIGGDKLFGKKLREHVSQILAKNQPTLIVAHQQLNDILNNLRAFRESLARLTDAFNTFRVGAEELGPGEAEVAFLVPRDAVHDKLGEFIEELDEIQHILNTLSEAATGHIDDLEIRTISSSGLMVFLKASAKFGEIVARCVDFVVREYKNILEIRRLREDMERLALPKEISERTSQYANEHMAEKIDDFAVEIMTKYSINDDGRRNELTTQMKFALRSMADRVDRGYSFEVRIEPPKALPNEPQEAQDLKQSLQAIQSAAPSMQYIRVTGSPILSLQDRNPVSSPEESTAKQKRKTKPPKE